MGKKDQIYYDINYLIVNKGVVESIVKNSRLKEPFKEIVDLINEYEIKL